MLLHWCLYDAQEPRMLRWKGVTGQWWRQNLALKHAMGGAAVDETKRQIYRENGATDAVLTFVGCWGMIASRLSWH